MKKTLNVLVPSVLALFVASAAHAGATFDTPQGKLNIGGDVEFDVTADNYSEDPRPTDSQSATGRLLLDINGERVLSNGNYAGFKLNPTWGQQGTDGADDVWFGFGVKNDWGFKLGHFEAYDLSPAGQDTYVADSGMTMYRANAARGRQDDGGQVQLTKENGQWHFELATMFGDDDGATDAATAVGITKNKDPLLARPVVAWTGDTVTVAAGAEVNLISDAYLETATGDDASDWVGYGATTTIKASDDLSFTLRGALRDADAQKDYTVGPGMQYQNFFAAYLYGLNNPDAGSDTKNHLLYASYKIPGVMGIDNFDMYLGASYGKIKPDTGTDSENYGARVRFKYFF